MRHHLPLIVLCCCLFTACNGEPDRLFTPVATDIDFVNALPENDSVNILLFEYLYNGGGVGVGDFDGNGLPDLFFSGNMVSSRLYLQTEQWQFKDVTEAAGLTTDVWCAGVNVADVDGNGYDDIYLATLNPSGENDVANLLFLNAGPAADTGIPTFAENAKFTGLADLGYGTHSAWFDYENDGDLDLYVLNNAIESYNRNVPKGTDTLGRGKSVDRLYRNVIGRETADMLNTPLDGRHVQFEPDTLQTEGWGLGLAVQDFNADGYADLYVANDFLSNDFLLMNRRGGGLRDELRQRLPHQSRNSMGVDAADINNDGRADIMVVDMLPDDNVRVKAMFGDTPHRGTETELQRGYARQQVRNTLQLNNGDGTFSDIAFQAGVAATDWSWAPLIMDVDNDGRRDIFVSNGYPKDITNKDFIDFNDNASTFGTSEKKIGRVVEALRDVAGVHQPNYLFRNDGEGLHFTPTDWLPAAPTYSNGAVLVDLDLDGDLDLVTNNINEPAGVFRNNLRETRPDSSHYLQLTLKGPPGNPGALGAKVWVSADGRTMYHEHYRQRGYLSTVDETVHFGLGAATTVDEVRIRFPDGKGVRLTDVSGDQRLAVAWNEALDPLPAPASAPKKVLETVALAAPVHKESLWSDFNTSALALRDRSRRGPALAAIDLEGDGVDELVFGGAAGQPVSIWKQDKGALTRVQNLEGTERGEATALAVFDYDGDGGQDLYVGNGSTEFQSKPELLVDLLYHNVNGQLILLDTGLKHYHNRTNTADYGTYGGVFPPSVFVGGDQPDQPGEEIFSRLMFLTEDDLITAQSLLTGPVSAAVFADFDGDRQPDVITAGDYHPLKFFRNNADGSYAGEEVPGSEYIFYLAPGKPLTQPGWFYSLTPCDLDRDGDLDLVAGNVGLNSPFRVSPERPLVLRADDYDGNGTIDPVVTAWNGDRAYPVFPRNTLTRQLPAWKKWLTTYAAYGAWTEDDLPPMSDKGIRREATEFRSLYLENDGAAHFTVRPLPALAQTAPLRDAAPITLADGRPALLCVQNDYAWEPLGGPLDAGTGFVLTLDAAGDLEVLPDYVSVRGDARSVVGLKNGEETVYYVGINNGAVLRVK